MRSIQLVGGRHDGRLIEVPYPHVCEVCIPVTVAAPIGPFPPDAPAVLAPLRIDSYRRAGPHRDREGREIWFHESIRLG